MECRCTFKGGNTIKNLLMAPKDQDANQKKVESFTDTNVTGWRVMRNTLVNPLELLVRGSKNISRAPSPIYDHYNTTGHNVTIDNF